jgi:putative 4-mercaptohistidine N1-methyltranferase
MQSIYETDVLLQQYLLFHYGTAEDQLPFPFGPRDALFYPVRCVSGFAPFFGEPVRALDLGCAVGRSTFELARYAGEAVGVDLSQSFIKAAQTMQRDGEISFSRLEEGIIATPLRRSLPAGIDRRRCRFKTGDATVYDPALGVFDVVLASNLLDRVQSPQGLLQNCVRYLRPGGTLILASPYTWLPDFTPPGAWLGGRFDSDGQRVDTLACLQSLLEPPCKLLHTADLPFLIREHARKYQWSVAQATVWRRNA